MTSALPVTQNGRRLWNQLSKNGATTDNKIEGDSGSSSMLHQSHHNRAASSAKWLDSLQLDELACAPQAQIGAILTRSARSLSDVSEPAAPGDGGHATSALPVSIVVGQSQNNELSSNNQEDHWTSGQVPLGAVYEYLEPTLLNRRPANETSGLPIRLSDTSPVTGPSHATHSSASADSGKEDQQQPELMVANEGDTIVLKCVFLALPSTSVDVIWLADYNRARQIGQMSSSAASRKGLSAPINEQTVLLYDSTSLPVQRPSRNNQSAEAQAALVSPNGLYNKAGAGQDDALFLSSTHFDEDFNPDNRFVELGPHGTRIVAGENRPDSERSILKESQIIIRSASVEDSAG